MKADPRFPRTVEAYKKYLGEDHPYYDSFQSFCGKQGVRYKGVTQWMRRHNQSIGGLQLEVLLEKNRNKSGFENSLVELSSHSFPIKKSVIPSHHIPPDKCIKGVTLIFPDGVSLCIRETTPMALINLLELYNKLTTDDYAGSE